MFKLIGIIVVVATVLTGYTTLHKWYEGKLTPEETIVNLRSQLGSAIKNSDEQPSKKQQSSDNDNVNSRENESAISGFSTDDAAHELIKHAND